MSQASYAQPIQENKEFEEEEVCNGSNPASRPLRPFRLTLGILIRFLNLNSKNPNDPKRKSSEPLKASVIVSNFPFTGAEITRCKE